MTTSLPLVVSAALSSRYSSWSQHLGQLTPACHAELGVDALEVVVDRAHRQHQLRRDLLAGPALGGRQGDLPFAGGERAPLGGPGQPERAGALAPRREVGGEGSGGGTTPWLPG